MEADAPKPTETREACKGGEGLERTARRRAKRGGSPKKLSIYSSQQVYYFNLSTR
jgi:hypothetical protein